MNATAPTNPYAGTNVAGPREPCSAILPGQLHQPQGSLQNKQQMQQQHQHQLPSILPVHQHQDNSTNILSPDPFSPGGASIYGNSPGGLESEKNDDLWECTVNTEAHFVAQLAQANKDLANMLPGMLEEEGSGSREVAVAPPETPSSSPRRCSIQESREGPRQSPISANATTPTSTSNKNSRLVIEVHGGAGSAGTAGTCRPPSPRPIGAGSFLKTLIAMPARLTPRASKEKSAAMEEEGKELDLADPLRAEGGDAAALLDQADSH
ncbi:unnamed protein product, partial [Amoebophrya sp. A25]|eukprot:GSA25T00023336001.1